MANDELPEIQTLHVDGVPSGGSHVELSPDFRELLKRCIGTVKGEPIRNEQGVITGRRWTFPIGASIDHYTDPAYQAALAGAAETVERIIAGVIADSITERAPRPDDPPPLTLADWEAFRARLLGTTDQEVQAERLRARIQRYAPPGAPRVVRTDTT